MQKENLLLITSAILSVLILVFSVYITFLKKPQTSNLAQEENNIQQQDQLEEEVEGQNTQDNTSEEEITPKVFTQSAWIPSWDFENGYKSLQNYKSVINVVNPVIYGVNNDGTLLSRKPSEDSLKKLITFASTNNIKVIPTIGSYDFKIMESTLGSQVYIEKLVEEIVREVNKYDFDGVDIDFEKIHSSEKTGYFTFLNLLNTELEKQDKELTVTVTAKTRDGKIDTLEVQDWSQIGVIADEVKIMAYDYTLQTSTTPGPIAPISWIEEVLQYAQTRLDIDKVSLGIHLYAYLWKGEKATALTYSSASDLVSNSKITQEYKEDLAEGYASYTCSDGSKCILYYQTQQGVKQRVDLAREYGLNGVSYWRLGSEEDLLDKSL